MRALAIGCLVVASAAAQNTLTPEEAAQGWRLLFDGTTMRGWLDPAKKDQPGDAWVIEDGCLKTRLKPRITEDLISRESFGSFELKFDWRVSPGANTGVKYRIQDVIFLDPAKNPQGKDSFEGWLGREVAQKRPSRRSKTAADGRAQEYTVGFEMQLIDDRRHPDARRDPRNVTGALYSMISPVKVAGNPAGEWNEGKIVLNGNRVEHWINGEVVLQATLDADVARAGIMKRWALAPSIRDALLNPKPSGPIALQHHGDEVWFRNIKLRPFETGAKSWIPGF